MAECAPLQVNNTLRTHDFWVVHYPLAETGGNLLVREKPTIHFDDTIIQSNDAANHTMTQPELFEAAFATDFGTKSAFNLH